SRGRSRLSNEGPDHRKCRPDLSFQGVEMRSRAIVSLAAALTAALMLGCDNSAVVDAAHRATLSESPSMQAQAARGGGGPASFATLIPLPTLSSSPSEALAVNRAGTVITGYGQERRGPTRAVRWTLQANGAWVIEALPLP